MGAVGIKQADCNRYAAVPPPLPSPSGGGRKKNTEDQSGTNLLLKMATSPASSNVATCPIFPSLILQAENRL